MPVAIQGAVITNENGQQISYQEKCDKCGGVSPGETMTSVAKYHTLNSSFMCSKCGNMQNIVIKG